MVVVVFMVARAERAGRRKLLGTLTPRPSSSIQSSKWSIGAETQDRNYTIYRNYEKYLEPLGAKRARLQGGWHRCVAVML